MEFDHKITDETVRLRKLRAAAAAKDVNPHTCTYQIEGTCAQRAGCDDLFDCLPENCPRLQ